jgi:hypothetical protein
VLGLATYEFLLIIRRPGLPVAAFVGILILTIIALELPLLMPPLKMRASWYEIMTISEISGVMSAYWITIILPVFWTDLIPIDFRIGMREIQMSLPFTDNVYLLGKFIGGLTASLILFTGVVVYQALLIKIAFGSFSSAYYLDQGVMFLLPLLIYLFVVSFSLGVWCRSRIESALMGTFVTVGHLILGMISGRVHEMRIAGPATGIALPYLMEKWGGRFGVFQMSDPVALVEIWTSWGVGLIIALALTLICGQRLRRRARI